MDFSNSVTSAYGNVQGSYSGLEIQQQRELQTVNETATAEAGSGRDTDTQDRALVEQNDIINSLQSNSRSLQASGDRVGTLVDVRV